MHRKPSQQQAAQGEVQAVLQQRLRGTHLRSLGAAMTRSQSRTLCFFRYFFVKYLRYLQ